MHICLIKQVQFVQNITPFQKVENDIRSNLFEQHLQRIYIEVLFSAIIRSEQDLIN